MWSWLENWRKAYNNFLISDNIFNCIKNWWLAFVWIGCGGGGVFIYEYENLGKQNVICQCITSIIFPFFIKRYFNGKQLGVNPCWQPLLRLKFYTCNQQYGASMLHKLGWEYLSNLKYSPPKLMRKIHFASMFSVIMLIFII